MSCFASSSNKDLLRFVIFGREPMRASHQTPDLYHDRQRLAGVQAGKKGRRLARPVSSRSDSKSSSDRSRA